ncbi:HD domain-containing protein [Aquisphaera insulae]|uniref:HD domain-containing protein n=1 Tax=Aquisphaera insulae TaxID=2712864 RepID=UPI0013EC6608|nr:HD domain-containing protein [Aquisphaera insulae]
MRWIDRVYGEVSIDDPGVLGVIESPTFRRLRGVRQAGPSAIAFPFKNVTRFEHSLGVHHLLNRLGAGPRERMAGLLHDISHTAFSHAVDFLITSDEQDHHEGLKPVLLRRPDLARAIERARFRPEDFFDDSRYPLLERPLPWLCADRLDYFLRDGLACGELGRSDAASILDHLDVADSTIVLTDVDVARRTAALFAEMNRKWWASPTEAFIYNEFADALREGLRAGILHDADLLSEDDLVLARLDASANTLIAAKLASIRHFDPSLAEGYAPRVVPKQRWLDPPVKVDGTVRLLSEWA